VANGELSWITNDYDGAIRRAKSENKPVFIDFTGYTCTNCRWMEANMFPKAPIKEELAKYVRVRLYTDGEGQPYEGFQRMQQEKFGTVALPLYVVVNSDGNVLATFPGLTRDQGEFVSFLKTLQARSASPPVQTTAALCTAKDYDSFKLAVAVRLTISRYSRREKSRRHSNCGLLAKMDAMILGKQL